MKKRIISFIVSLIIFLSIFTVHQDISALNESRQLQTEAVITSTNLKYDVDFSASSEGYVRVLYNAGSTKKIKLIIENNGNRYTYNLKSSPIYLNFPLQLGDGKYDVKIYENTTGTSYRKIYSESGQVDVENELQIFLISVQEISWTEESKAILKAEALLQDALVKKQKTSKIKVTELTQLEKIKVIYDYVTQTITYDYDKIDGLSYDYIPDIDKVLEEGQGICYDYSALFAAMLRSQGIPAKMAKGYTTVTDVYHAWNEVYLEEEERWIVVDTTFDAYMRERGYAYKLESDSAKYSKTKEF